MGSMFGGGETKTTTTSDTSPWAPQAGPVSGLLTGAADLQKQQSQTPFPFTHGSDFYTPMNQEQTRGYENLGNTGQIAAGYAPMAMYTGAQQLGGLNVAQNAAQNVVHGNYDHGQTAGGYSAGNNIPNAVNNANAGTVGAMQGALANNSTNVAQQAGNYINNGVLRGQIDAVGTDIRRNLNEQQLPQLNAQADATGNMDSTRAGVAQGIAERGANENLTNAAAQMRGQAYSQGLNLAEGQNVANNNTMLGAANAANYSTGAGISGQSASNATTMAGNQLQQAGAGMLTQQAGLGMGMMGAGDQLGSAAGAQQAQAGGAFQQDRQNINNGDMSAFQAGQAYPWQGMDRASNIIQARNWGGTTNGTSSVQQPQNVMGDIISLGSLAAAPFTGGASLAGVSAGQSMGKPSTAAPAAAPGAMSGSDSGSWFSHLFGQ